VKFKKIKEQENFHNLRNERKTSKSVCICVDEKSEGKNKKNYKKKFFLTKSMMKKKKRKKEERNEKKINFWCENVCLVMLNQ
jgi:hypothetical protein